MEKTISNDGSSKDFWSEINKIKAIRIPMLEYVLGMSEEKLFIIMLNNDYNSIQLAIDESVLIIEGKSYWIINREHIHERVFID